MAPDYLSPRSVEWFKCRLTKLERAEQRKKLGAPERCHRSTPRAFARRPDSPAPTGITRRKNRPLPWLLR